MFTVSDSSRCLINKYAVLDTAGAVIADTEDLYSLLDLVNRVETDIAVPFNTTLGPQDSTVLSYTYSFKIEASNVGGVTAQKEVTFNLVVCSATIDTLVLDADTTAELDADQGTGLFEISIGEYFVPGDSDCEEVAYAIYMTADTSTLPTPE